MDVVENKWLDFLVHDIEVACGRQNHSFPCGTQKNMKLFESLSCEMSNICQVHIELLMMLQIRV